MKKRILATIMTVIMVFSAIPMGCLNEICSLFTPKAYALDADKLYYGDIDENGKITASDARTVLRCAAGIQEITQRQLKIADMNGDNKITASDARKILRTAANLEAPVVFVDDEAITQGDYLQQLMGSMGLSGSNTTTPYFENIPETHPLFDTVQSAVDWGILDPDSEFDPDAEATYEFVADTTMNATDITDAEDLNIDPDTDMSESCSQDAIDNILDFAKQSVLNSSDKNEFENIEYTDDVEAFNASEITPVDEDTYTFRCYGDEIPEKGDIFIADTENGQFAEKIVAVTENSDGTYSIETVQPAMDEVFEEFSFNKTASVSADEIEFIPAEGVLVSDDTSALDTIGSTYSREKKEEKIVFQKALTVTSSKDPTMTPEMVLKTTSDYIDALNCEYSQQYPTIKSIVEENNRLITGAKEDDPTTLESEEIDKYESGWIIETAIKLSNLEFDCNFKEFWTTGNYSITLKTDILEFISFKGTFQGKSKLGSFKVPLGVADIVMDVTIDFYIYVDVEGDITLVGNGRIEQTYENKDGRTKHLNNNTFSPTFEANVKAEGGFIVEPNVGVLGFELAYMSIQIGAYVEINFKAVPVVEYKGERYYYAGDFFRTPEELEQYIFSCLNLSLSIPIVRITVSAGEDVIKQIEKLKDDGLDIGIPLTHTFKICTLDDDSMIKPITLATHFEFADGSTDIVDECTMTSFEKLAHKCMGFVVEKNTDKAVANAKVELVDSKGNIVSSATTDADGEFELKYIPFGEYNLKITSDNTEMTWEETVKIEKNETYIGKVEFELDIVKIYADFLKKQGKTVKIATEYDTFKFNYCDSAICKLDGNSKHPQLIVSYVYDYGWGSFFFVCRIYKYENSAIKLAKEYISDGATGLELFKIWNDPVYNKVSVLRHYSGNHTNDCQNIYPLTDWVGYTFYNTTGYGEQYKNNYSNTYKKYLSQFEYISPGIDAKTIYELSWQKSDKINIAVIDNNGKYAIKTFSF